MSVTPEELQEIVESLVGQVEAKIRKVSLDMMVPNPEPDEIEYSLYEALAEINSYAPQTTWTIDQVYSDQDQRWKFLLVLGAAVYSFDRMIAELSGNSVDIQIQDFTLTSKLTELSTLRESWYNQFTQMLDKLKTASQKFSHYKSFATVPTPTGNWLRYVRYKYSRMR